MKITAALTRSIDSAFELTTLTLEEPRGDEMLVRIVAAGMCHTDLAVRSGVIPGEFPRVLGHEGSGIVEKVGAAVTAFAPGDRVALSFAFCGDCENCQAGRVAYCLRMMALNLTGARPDGSTTLTDSEGAAVRGSFFGQSSFATHVLVSEAFAVAIPDDVPLELVGPLGCGLQTGAGAVLNSLAVPVGSTIAIAGVGAVGLAAIMAAAALGSRIIIAIDVLPERQELARELGATHTLNGADPLLAEKIREISDGGVAYSCDTTGRPEVVTALIEATQFGGKIGIIGAARPEATIPLTLVSGKFLIGLSEGDSVPRNFMPRLLALYRAGKFPFDRLITFYPFADIEKAVADTASGAAVKAVLRMD